MAVTLEEIDEIKDFFSLRELGKGTRIFMSGKKGENSFFFTDGKLITNIGLSLELENAVEQKAHIKINMPDSDGKGFKLLDYISKMPGERYTRVYNLEDIKNLVIYYVKLSDKDKEFPK